MIKKVKIVESEKSFNWVVEQKITLIIGLVATLSGVFRILRFRRNLYS